MSRQGSGCLEGNEQTNPRILGNEYVANRRLWLRIEKYAFDLFHMSETEKLASDNRDDGLSDVDIGEEELIGPMLNLKEIAELTEEHIETGVCCELLVDKLDRVKKCFCLEALCSDQAGSVIIVSPHSSVVRIAQKNVEDLYSPEKEIPWGLIPLDICSFTNLSSIGEVEMYDSYLNDVAGIVDNVKLVQAITNRKEE
ncbi:hypothetical protein AgCh_032395 [Apium graveolens]